MRLYFNDGKQWLDVEMELTYDEFREKYNSDAEYGRIWEGRHSRKGKFGTLYLPRMELTDTYFHELVAHEVQHAVLDWILARKQNNLRRFIENNEERIATMTGDIVRQVLERI